LAYLIDTNVISELVRPTPDASVVAWARSVSPLEQYLSVLTLGELDKGIGLLPAGARRSQLAEWAHTAIPRQFLGRVLPIDASVAVAWGQLSAAARVGGRQLPVIDGLLVATAVVHKLTIVTRNVGDCADHGVAVLDPWSGTLHS
jgi:hypothetical protein